MSIMSLELTGYVPSEAVGHDSGKKMCRQGSGLQLNSSLGLTMARRVRFERRNESEMHSNC